MLHARKDYNFRIQDSDNRIGRKEPVFLFRAQDKLMLPILEHYLLLLGSQGNPPLRVAVLKHMARVLEWQTDNEIKEPDTPPIEIL